MDVKTYVSILRQHSEHLEKIAGQLNRSLQELADRLSAQRVTTYAEAQPLAEGLPRLSHYVAREAEILSQRIRAFIEKTATGDGTDSPAV
jgi:hypothetical protein